MSEPGSGEARAALSALGQALAKADPAMFAALWPQAAAALAALERERDEWKANAQKRGDDAIAAKAQSEDARACSLPRL